MKLSERLFKILKAKTDLTNSELENVTEREGWRIVYSMTTKKEKLIEICFTGFSASYKKALIYIAKEHNFHVAKSITVDLAFLCCGPNAGPKKMILAKKKGAQFLSKDEFIDLIETGEIPIVSVIEKESEDNK